MLYANLLVNAAFKIFQTKTRQPDFSRNPVSYWIFFEVELVDEPSDAVGLVGLVDSFLMGGATDRGGRGIADGLECKLSAYPFIRTAGEWESMLTGLACS